MVEDDGFSERALWAYYALAQLPFFWIVGVLEAPLTIGQVMPRIIGAISFMFVGQTLASALLWRAGYGDRLGARRLLSLLFGPFSHGQDERPAAEHAECRGSNDEDPADVVRPFRGNLGGLDGNDGRRSPYRETGQDKGDSAHPSGIHRHGTAVN